MHSGPNADVYQGSMYKSDAQKFTLKFIFDNADSLKMSANEVEILRKLSHDNIVQYYGKGINEDYTWCYVFEFVDFTLKRVIETSKNLKRHLTPEDVKTRFFMRQLLEGLDYLHHQCKIIHRGLKTSNLLISETGVLKISDFKRAIKTTTYNAWIEYAPEDLHYLSIEMLLGKFYFYWSKICIMAITTNTMLMICYSGINDLQLGLF